MPPSMKRGPSLAHLETAFSQFDLDGTGSVTVADLEAILMRPGPSALSKEDVAEIMGMFDEDGSGTLDLFEFEKAMSMFGSFLTENKEALEHEHECHKLAALSACAAPHAKQIKEMFGKMDEDASGKLVPSEGTLSRDVMVFYYEGMGLEFEDDTIAQWHAAHASGEAGLDVESFGRFLAELAQCDDSLMGGVIESFSEALEYILMRRAMSRAEDVKKMKAEAKASGSKPMGGEAQGPPRRKLMQSGSQRFARLARKSSSEAL